MLVVTPQQNASVDDHKPRVISEVRKTQSKRSPSLDGNPRLSGILHHYCETERTWRPKFAAIREGTLLVYPSERDPVLSSGFATLGRLSSSGYAQDLLVESAVNQYHTLSHDYSEISTPNRGYFSLENFDNDILRDGSTNWIKETPRSRYDVNTPIRRDSEIGCRSLGRQYRSHTPGAPSMRLPLRHLNLRSFDARPNAFTLSRKNDDGTAPVAIFQATSRRDYERWVKTLAVEILRQTPLDAVRFIDVLGIAAFESTKKNVETPSHAQSCTVCSNGGYCNVTSCKRNIIKTDSKTTPIPTPRGRAKAKVSVIEADNIKTNESLMNIRNSELRRRNRVEDSTEYTTADTSKLGKRVIEFKYSPLPPRKYDRKTKAQRILFANNEMKKDVNDIYANIDKRLQCNGKMTLLSVETSHGNENQDEGIVVEDFDYEDSSSEQSYGRNSRKARRESENSGLDSPKSITSHSSYSEGNGNKTSRETLASNTHHDSDTVDGYILHTKHLPSKILEDRSYQYRSELLNCNSCKSMSLQPTNTINKNLESYAKEINISANNLSNLRVNDAFKEKFHSLQYYENYDFDKSNKFIKNSDISRSSYGRWSWEVANAKKKSLSLDCNRLYTRARSASPNKGGVSVQRRVASCSRFGRVSINEDVSENDVEEVNALKIRCQDTEHYVPVKEKLALFETLSVMGHRLARSSEDLVLRKLPSNEQITTCKRACSFHDLSESKIATVPVKEMCKFFETIGHDDRIDVLTKREDLNQKKPIACVVRWKTGDNEISIKKTKPLTQSIKIVNEDIKPHNDIDVCFEDFDSFNCRKYQSIIRGNKIISYV